MSLKRVVPIGFALSLALAAACGGGGSSTTPPPSGGGTGTTPTNPCTNALVADETSQPMTGMVAGGAAAPVSDKKILVDGDPRGRVLEALWIHQAAERTRTGRIKPDATRPAPISQDVGDIAVIQDEGDIVLPANPFDLRTAGLRFTPGGGGYTVTKIDATFRPTLGTRVTLGDDDSAEVDVPFGFSFYGAQQKAAFVNSDGNITFGEQDKASTDRNVARLLTGPPRVSPFLADLDPSSGGKVFVNAASDQYTVTWCAVPGFGSTHVVTAQATILPDASIEFKYADTTTLGDAVVGLSPGRTSSFTPADLSVPTPLSGIGAIAERFAAAVSLDTIAVGKKFYATHGDTYDQILLWTDQRLIVGAFSYETTIANEVQGIGEDIYNLSSEFGSAGRLRSVVVMDFVGKFPDDPTQKFLGENNTLSVMGQEVGHRWLAYVNFRDRTGASSDALLGRDLAHWSFFFNSDGSVMEGNQIQDLGGSQFKTGDAVKRYSRLDQYAMGLVPPSQVPTMFYVESPTGTTHQPADAPQSGVSFGGTRRDFLIGDIIAVNGDRRPSAADAPKTHRQAFLYIVSAGKTVDPAQVAKVDTFRKAWEGFFSAATENRMTAVTRLQ